MAHVLHRATLALATSLGTPLAGDTLFGQICWALRETKGDAELTRRLAGYTGGNPWVVVSDGFPAGHLPKPTLPTHFVPHTDPTVRKAAKAKRWVPVLQSGATLSALLGSAVDDATAYRVAPHASMQAHNTLNRSTGSTGDGVFAPYSMPQTFFAPGQHIDVYLLLDEERLPVDEAQCLLSAIGAGGFGRDASIGLGKFSVAQIERTTLTGHGNANAFWTLGPCIPESNAFDTKCSYWRTVTRFGRHGNAHALAANPFKAPVLMATTGAVFTPCGAFSPRAFIGKGLGSDGSLSKVQPATVHQGYAPVLPIAMELKPI